MPIDFFDQELIRCQERFGEIYRQINVCNTRAQAQVVITILSMGLTARKIQAAKTKNEVREDIKKFVRAKDVLTDLFNKTEQQLKTTGGVHVEPTKQRTA